MEVDCDKPCILKDIFYDGNRLAQYCNEIVRKKNRAMLDKLRPMERKLLPYFGKGILNKQIADKFYLTESTVKSHKRNAIKNLGLKNSAELICFIVKCGIV